MGNDEEMFRNLDMLLNLEELEESDFWDEMMNLGELESDQKDAGSQKNNGSNN